jgi:hypothetical protein
MVVVLKLKRNVLSGMEIKKNDPSEFIPTHFVERERREAG